MTLITLEERKGYRKTLGRLRELADTYEQKLDKRLPVPVELLDAMEPVVNTRLPAAQLQAMQDLLAQLEPRYHARLQEAAPTDFSCFCEYLDPEEPPAAHHEFLIQHLVAVEQRDLLRLMISMPPGHAKAGTVDTLVTMADGTFKRLGDVVVGDHVIAGSGVARRVSAVHEQGVLPSWRITTELGRELIFENDHPFLTLTGWKNAEDLCPSDFLLMPAGVSATDTSNRSIEEFRLLGYLIGDGAVGTYGKSQACSFTNMDEDVLDAFVHTALALGFGVTPVDQRRRATTYRLSGALDWLRASGIAGMTGHTKRVPAWVYQGSPEKIAAFIAAYFECDGTINQRGGARQDCCVEFCSINRDLLRDTQRLALRLGLNLRLAEKPTSDAGKRVLAHRLTLSSMHEAWKWYRVIPLVGAKAQRLATWAPYPTQVDGPYLLDRVRTVEPATPVAMRCLTVEVDHSFLAEDVVVHNSTYCSHKFPAWYLARHKHHKYIQAGHSQGFVENQFGKKVRSIIQDPRFELVFPEIRLGTESKAAGFWQLANSRGYYLTRGVGQGISGYRGDIQAVDDPFASREDAESPTVRDRVFDWFSADFTTRLLPKSPLFIIATRWHSDDLCGRVERMNKEGRMLPPYEIINLTAICEDEDDPMGRPVGAALWPDFFDLDILLSLKGSLPARDWNSLYRGRPVDEEGGVVTAAELYRYAELPRDECDAHGNVVRQRVLRRTLSVDCAAKKTQRSDYTALTVWFEGMDHVHYLAFAAHQRVEFNDMVRFIEGTARLWNVDEILVEDRGSGTQYIQTRQLDAPAPVIAIATNQESKEFRFDGVSPLFTGGRVLLPERASWLPEYEAELLAFPNGSHDDFVDSTSQYLARHRQLRRRGTKKLSGHTTERH